MKWSESEVLILGSHGMLGQHVKRYFGPRCEALRIHDERYRARDHGDYVRRLSASEPDVVINCIGCVKQRSVEPETFYEVNTLLPLELSQGLSENTLLVHPSTDCVFEGSSGQVRASGEDPDATDCYGWSKALGERALLARPRTLIPRASFIGRDVRREGPGLLNWFLRQEEGSEIRGYVNHHWNGLTVLEWCKRVEQLADPAMRRDRGLVVHLGTERATTKFELLKTCATIFDKDVAVIPWRTGESVHRVLAPDVRSPDIVRQLIEYRDEAKG